MTYTCDKCGSEFDNVPEYASHKRWQHKKRKKAAKVVATVKRVVKKAIKAVKRRAQRQEKSQHIPRPENFDVSGCGIQMYYDHLTFIPDLDDPSITVEYLDKERVCKKCRKRYKLDSVLAKRRK